jgi:predicted permease
MEHPAGNRSLFAALSLELRQALRRLAQAKGLSSAVVLTLALAIAANAAVFSLVRCVLLSPLPYPDPDRLVGFWMTSPAFSDNAPIRQSPATYLHFGKHNRTFDSMALAEPETVTLDDGHSPERLQAALVTSPLYRVLRTPAAAGRTLSREDSLPGAEPVLVLSHELWASRFGRDRSVVGRTFKIDGVLRKVVGVLPPGLNFPAEDTRLWLPLEFDPAAPVPLRFRYAGYGRLKAGVSPQTAVNDLDRLINTLPDAYPDGFSRQVIEEAEIRSQVRPLKEEIVGDIRPALWTLLGAVLAVLLIATANLASLFAVRADSRHQELAVRNALGARRWQLLASLLAEGFWLAAAGTAAGLLLAVMALQVLKLLATGEIPRLDQVRLDAGVAALTAGIALFAGLLAGAVSALEVGWRSLNEHLRTGLPGTGEKPAKTRLRDVLVVAQVALALVLAVGSGLLVRSYWALSRTEVGFQAQDVLTLRVALPESDYGEWPRVVDFFHRYADQVRALPEVRAAAVASDLPLRDEPLLLPFILEDDPKTSDEVRPMALTKLVSDGYFATLGIPVLAGRPLARADAEEARGSVVVNQAFADQHWRGKDPLGRRLRLGSGETWLTVVGLVGNVLDRSVVKPAEPILYIPLQGPESYYFARWEMSVAVRSGRAEGLVPSLRRTLAQMDRGLPVYQIQTLDQVVEDASARTRFTAVLLVMAALGALILGAVGLYGLVAFTVVRRRREIGIRMALGAQRGRVRAMVVGKALTLACLGVVLGGAGAIYLGRFLASQLYQVRPSDPLTLAGAVAVMTVVAWLAGDMAARRAARLDPAATLRDEK